MITRRERLKDYLMAYREDGTGFMIERWKYFLFLTIYFAVELPLAWSLVVVLRLEWWWCVAITFVVHVILIVIREPLGLSGGCAGAMGD